MIDLKNLPLQACVCHSTAGLKRALRLPTNTDWTLVLKIKRMDNLDLLVADVEGAVDFYHGVLGLDFRLPYVPAENMAALDTGNVTIFLFKAGEGTHEPRRGASLVPDNPPGLDSIAFHVDDLEEAMAELEGKVEWVTDEPFEWSSPNGSWSRFRPMYDPEGNMVYLTQMHRAEGL